MKDLEIIHPTIGRVCVCLVSTPTHMTISVEVQYHLEDNFRGRNLWPIIPIKFKWGHYYYWNSNPQISGKLPFITEMLRFSSSNITCYTIFTTDNAKPMGMMKSHKKCAESLDFRANCNWETPVSVSTYMSSVKWHWHGPAISKFSPRNWRLQPKHENNTRNK